jgi:hypothetical protein
MSFIYKGTHFIHQKSNNSKIVSYEDIPKNYIPTFITMPNSGWGPYNRDLDKVFGWMDYGCKGLAIYPSIDGVELYYARKQPICFYFEHRNDALFAKLQLFP